MCNDNDIVQACPTAIIICNPTDYSACNTQFFEYFGSSADHGRSVLGDFEILKNKYKRDGHVVQARAATTNESSVFHAAEFLVGAGEYTYLGISHSPGWGCDDGWLEPGVPGDPDFWRRPLGEPMADFSRVAGGAVPAVPKNPGEQMTGDWVYTRSFAGKHGSRAAAARAMELAVAPPVGGDGAEIAAVDAAMTHVWLNLTDGAFWKHAKSCVKASGVAPKPTCPQVCIWWADGNVSHWPPASVHVCDKAALLH